MTERNLDDSLGKAYMGEGAATVLAGLGGGSGTTTYAENIGVMAATKVWSTAAYVIAVLGARIWIESRVDFRDSVNLLTAAVAVIVGAANYTLTWGDLEFNGIALGSFGAIIIYQVLRALGGVPGTGADLGEGAIASPAGGVAPAAPRGRVEGEPPVADPPGGGGRGAGDEPGDRPAREP